MNSDLSDFPAMLSTLIDERGLSPRDICLASNGEITTDKLRKWRLGLVLPSLNAAAILADILGVPLDVLTGRKSAEKFRPPKPPPEPKEKVEGFRQELARKGVVQK